MEGTLQATVRKMELVGGAFCKQRQGVFSIHQVPDDIENAMFLYKCRIAGRGNVLKPVPQPPLEPELDLNKASGTKFFWGRPCHVDAQHGPKQEAGVQGGRNSPPGGVWGEAPEASDDLYLLQPIVQ